MLERERARSVLRAGEADLAAAGRTSRDAVTPLAESLRAELGVARSQAEQAAFLVGTTGVATTACAVVTLLKVIAVLLADKPELSSGGSPEQQMYHAIEAASFLGLLAGATVLPAAALAYARQAGGSPYQVLMASLRRWRQRMGEGRLLTALLDPVRLELLFTEERKHMRLAAQLAPPRTTLLSQLRFAARHANGLARCAAAPEGLNTWHFLRLWLLQSLDPLLGGVFSGFVMIGTPFLLVLGWSSAWAMLPVLPAAMAGLLALARERLEARAALTAGLETLLGE